MSVISEATRTTLANAAHLGARLEARSEVIAAAILDRIREAAPDRDRDSDPERVQAMRDTIAAATGSVTSQMKSGEVSANALPPGAWENVRLAVRHGMSLSTTLQSYVTGHLVTWEFIVEEAESLRLAAHERIALLKRASQLETAFFNTLVTQVSEQYTRELKLVTRSRQQRRAQLVRDVLDGGHVSEAELGYVLDGEHLAVIVSADRPDDVARDVGLVAERQALTVSRSERTAWLWLGGQSVDPCRLARKLNELVPEDASVAVGEPASGVAGFRLTHAQARAAHAVAQRARARVTRYADVSVLAWGLADEVLGPAFVDLYLGPLDRDPQRGPVLRETLRAYFATGHNGASAAAMLGVHKRTVTLRLRTIEELLGFPLHSKRVELETALRLEALRAAGA